MLTLNTEKLPSDILCGSRAVLIVLFIVNKRRVNLTCLLLFIALAVFAISPLEMVRTKIQSEQLKYSQVLTAVQHTVKEGGMVKSLYRGFTPTLLRDVPFSGQSKLHIYVL